MVKNIKEREDIIEERKEISQTGSRRTVSATPSSWWEDRKRIEQPNPEDQEKRYREEQEKYGQERERTEYFRSIQETPRTGQEFKERYESEKQMRAEGEEKKDISQTMSDTYKEFYGKWVKTFQNSFGKFHEIPTMESNKETFEKLLVSAEETNKIYGSWIAELEQNSRATREVLQGEPDTAKYTEAYDM
jgi:signal recognition particle GTPase